tara:strand:- start:1247 stop:1450 length:204 start_codon:yes stop_codon:yes gene_type:complete
MQPDAEADEGWVALVNEIADQTISPDCNSWSLGDNIPGKPRVFMPFVAPRRESLKGRLSRLFPGNWA